MVCPSCLMRRERLEHVPRAASQIADDPDMLIIGGQPVLGSIPEDRIGMTASYRNVKPSALLGAVPEAVPGGGL